MTGDEYIKRFGLATRKGNMLTAEGAPPVEIDDRTRAAIAKFVKERPPADEEATAKKKRPRR